MNLESRIKVPFELGTYCFDLVWKSFNVGHSSLSFSQIEPIHLPLEAKSVYDGSGDVYKVEFEACLDIPLLQRIVRHGLFISYVQVKDNDAYPLMSIAKAVLLGNSVQSVSVYDREQCKLIIDQDDYYVDREKMPLLKDPVSHVLHLLFRKRNELGSHFCGYFHDAKGNLERLDVVYDYEDDVLVGKALIPAHAYVLDTQVTLCLPYSYNAKEETFTPSLKEKVGASHRLLGRVWFDFKDLKTSAL